MSSPEVLDQKARLEEAVRAEYEIAGIKPHLPWREAIRSKRTIPGEDDDFLHPIDLKSQEAREAFRIDLFND